MTTVLNPELYNKKGELRPRPPKQYECTRCGFHMSRKQIGLLKLPGVTFVLCGGCGTGKIKDRPLYQEWLRLRQKVDNEAVRKRVERG